MRLLLLLLLLSAPSFAWYGEVHELIAWIAWTDLQPAVQARIEAIMSQHPDPTVRSFARGAVWPDECKEHGRPETASWHYVNVPHSLDGTPTVPPATPNVATIVPWLEKELAAGHNLPENLSFYAHFIGDLHQPLHAVTAFSKEFPDGDRGGSRWKLPGGGNLHQYWDSVGNLSVPDDRQQLAAQLRAAFPRSSYPELADPTLEGWLREGEATGIKVAYSWPGAQEPTRAAGLRRVVLAGYRLADRLNNLLGGSGQSSLDAP